MTGLDQKTTGPTGLLRNARLVPVLTIAREADAVPLARALVAGGVCTLEITLRTAAGMVAAKLIHAEVEDAIVGLGTVTTRRDLDVCVNNGLKFAFSPGASPALLDAAAEIGLDFVPGVQTASEIMACLERGFDVMKFFPASQAGGIPTLKALAGPFPQRQILSDRWDFGRNRRPPGSSCSNVRRRRRVLAGSGRNSSRQGIGTAITVRAPNTRWTIFDA